MSKRADIEDIRYAYRLLLGRQPDAPGLATFTKCSCICGLKKTRH